MMDSGLPRYSCGTHQLRLGGHLRELHELGEVGEAQHRHWCGDATGNGVHQDLPLETSAMDERRCFHDTPFCA
jgi:hypothetical protein